MNSITLTAASTAAPTPIMPILTAGTLRDVPDRSKGAEIGYVICPRTNVALKSESGIEHNGVLCVYSDPAIERVLLQSARITYTDEHGQRHDHTLDLRAKRYDGYIYGLLGKPDSKAVEEDLHGFAQRLSAFTPKKVADELTYFTERSMPEYQVRNSAAMLSCRREPRTTVDTALAEMAPEIEGDISIAQLCANLGGGAIAFRPVIRAILYGTLERMTDGLITPETVVRFSGAVMPDLDAEGPLRVSGLDHVASRPPKPKKPKPNHKHHSFRKG